MSKHNDLPDGPGFDRLCRDIAAAPDITAPDTKFLAFAKEARKRAYGFSRDANVAEPIFRAIIGGYGQGHADACDAIRQIDTEIYAVTSNDADASIEPQDLIDLLKSLADAGEQVERFGDDGPCCGGGSQCRCGGAE